MLSARWEEGDAEPQSARRSFLCVPAARARAVAPEPLHLHDNGAAAAEAADLLGFV